MITDQVETDLKKLITILIKEEYCGSEEEEEDPSGLCLTVGTNDGSSWGYQTGDNSFTGGAYGFQHWAVLYIYEDSIPAEVVKEIFSQWTELMCS